MEIESKGYLIDDDVQMTPPVELKEWQDEKLLFKKEGTPYNIYQPYRDVTRVLAITNKRVIVRPKQGETSPDEELWEKNSFDVYHHEIEKMYYNKRGGEGNKTLRIEISDGSVKLLPKVPSKREAMKYIRDLADLKRVKAEGESGIAGKAVKKFGGTVLTLFGIGLIIVGILIAFTIILIPVTILLLIIGLGIITAGVRGATSEKKWVKKESSETKDRKREDLKSKKENSSKAREQTNVENQVQQQTSTNPPQQKSQQFEEQQPQQPPTQSQQTPPTSPESSTQQSQQQDGKPCPECDRPMRYVEQYERWYCDNCGKYQ